MVPPILENSHSATVSIFYEQVARSLGSVTMIHKGHPHFFSCQKRFRLGEGICFTSFFLQDLLRCWEWEFIQKVGTFNLIENSTTPWIRHSQQSHAKSAFCNFNQPPASSETFCAWRTLQRWQKRVATLVWVE